METKKEKRRVKTTQSEKKEEKKNAAFDRKEKNEKFFSVNNYKFGSESKTTKTPSADGLFPLQFITIMLFNSKKSFR